MDNELLSPLKNWISGDFLKTDDLSQAKVGCVFLKSQVLLKCGREPAGSVPLGCWLEMQDLRLTPQLPTRNLHFNKIPPGGSQAHSCVSSAAL